MCIFEICLAFDCHELLREYKVLSHDAVVTWSQASVCRVYRGPLQRGVIKAEKGPKRERENMYLRQTSTSNSISSGFYGKKREEKRKMSLQNTCREYY